MTNANDIVRIDLAQAKKDYATQGYCIVPDVLTAAELAAVRQRVDEQAAAERALGWAWEDGGQGQKGIRDYDTRLDEVVGQKGGVNQKIGMLVNKGQVFRDLVTHPTALGLVEYVLGPQFLLSSIYANIAKKGGALEALHRDAWWFPMPYRGDGDAYTRVGDRSAVMAARPPEGINIAPGACNCIWMVTDFNDENGGTRLVPGSHLRSENPDPSVPHKVPTIAATGKAGSICFFDGRLWHATGQNKTDEPRIGLLSYYCGPQIRQNDNHFLGPDPAVVAQCSDKLLDLLGYTTWGYFGKGDVLSSRRRLRAREPWVPEMRLRPQD